MSAIRYTEQLRANVVSVKNDILLGGNIHYDDGSLLSLDTVGNIVGNIDDINTVGNIGNIGSVDTILNVNNIENIENATQHTDSIGNIIATEAIIGDVQTIAYMDVQEASIAGNVGNIIDMSGTIANLHGGVGSIGNVPGNIENIDGNVDTIYNHGVITGISGSVSTVRDGSIDEISGGVSTIGTNAHIGMISSTITEVRGIDQLDNVSGVIDSITGSIGTIGYIDSIITIDSHSGNLVANTVGDIGTLIAADIGNVSNIGNVNAIENDTIGIIDHIVTANIENASNVGSVGNINNAGSIGIIGQVEGNVDIETYYGNINAESGVYINQPMEPGYPLAVTGDAKIDGNLDVSGNINSGQNLYVTSNVGIGTTSPTAKLDVDGTTRLRGAVTTDSSLTVNDRITSYSSEEPMARFQANSSATRRFLVENVGGGSAMYRLRTISDGNTTHDWGLATRNSIPGMLTFFNYGSNTHQLVMDGDGRVGIGNAGTSSNPIVPTASLDVYGTTRLRGDVAMDSSLTVDGRIFAGNPLHTNQLAVTDPSVYLHVNAGMPVLDDQPVSVEDCATILISTFPDGGGEQGYIGKIAFGGGEHPSPTDSTYSAAYIAASTTSDFGPTSTPTDLEFWTTPAGSKTAQKRVIIDRNGNVGISSGATTPVAKLDVDGTTRLRGAVTTDSSLTVNGQIHSNLGLSATSATNTPLRLQSTGGTGSNWGITSRTDGRLQFYDYTGTAPVPDVMVLTNTGRVGINRFGPSYELDVEGNINSRQNLYVTSNVGIGTTSPAAKLDVNGNVNIEGITTLGRYTPSSIDISLLPTGMTQTWFVTPQFSTNSTLNDAMTFVNMNVAGITMVIQLEITFVQNSSNNMVGWASVHIRKSGTGQPGIISEGRFYGNPTDPNPNEMYQPPPIGGITADTSGSNVVLSINIRRPSNHTTVTAVGFVKASIMKWS